MAGESSPAPRGALTGRGVLVTRPAAQAERLCGLIEAAGGTAVRFPTIAIEPCADATTVQRLCGQNWDLLYFVSRNAVTEALALGADGRWPNARQVAAVGRATAQALAAAGRAPDLVPDRRFESEALLALPELARMDGQRVLIVRGEGGRAIFADTLRARGAQVEFAEVYRRVIPALDAGALVAHWLERIALVTTTSDQVLFNLIEMLGPAGRGALVRTPLVVIAERGADTARALGFVTVEVAEQATDEAIVAALERLSARLV